MKGYQEQIKDWENDFSQKRRRVFDVLRRTRLGSDAVRVRMRATERVDAGVRRGDGGPRGFDAAAVVVTLCIKVDERVEGTKRRHSAKSRRRHLLLAGRIKHYFKKC